MSNKILNGLEEALAFTNGEAPAARLTINGHQYVPEAALPPTVAELMGLLRLIAKHTAPGDRTMDQIIKDMDIACDYARSALSLLAPRPLPDKGERS